MNTPFGANAYILAGGASRRFGSDKALQDWQGKPLLQHMVHTLEQWFHAVSVVARADQSFADVVDVPVLHDHHTHCGPLGGIHKALATSESNWNFIVACDMPLVQLAVIQLLWGHCAAGVSVVVPEVEGHLLPTQGFYHRNALASLENFLSGGVQAAYLWAQSVPHVLVPEADVRVVDANLQSATNLNTLEARAHALRLQNPGS